MGAVSSMDGQGVAPPDTDLGSCAVSRAAIHIDRGTERTTKVFSQGSGGQKSESKVSEGPPPSQGSRGGPSCFFQLLVAQHSLACVHITPVSASVISWPCCPCICVFSSSVSCRDTRHWI